MQSEEFVTGHGCGVVCGVGCGKTDYTATLKVFRVRVLSVATKKKKKGTEKLTKNQKKMSKKNE